MTKVQITIDGQKIAAEAGSTVLEAAREAGLDIPTLCHHPALSNWGACRICLVEIERQRALQTACTFPVTEGMVVHTESEKVVAARKFVLQLLFSERNHYCMYCQMSGDCELQSLAYRYGLTEWPYPRPVEPLAVDATRQYFVMDHNRCILCRRCVRACAELVANHTLGVRERGIHSMITADLNVPMGESSCIQCGTCLQVCPTGALMDLKSAYRGRETQVERTRSTCVGCSIGCGIELVSRANHLVRIEGDWDAEVNKGLLCVVGRFEPLFDDRQRVTQPLVRRRGLLEPCEWDEALGLVAEKLSGDSLAALITTRATNETMTQFGRLFRSLGAEMAAVGSLAPAPGAEGRLTDLAEADVILVVGADLKKDHQVAGAFVRRAVDRGARLALVADADNGLASYATWHVGFDQMDSLVGMAAQASRPVVVCAADLPAEAEAALAPLAGKASFLGLSRGSNSRGAVAAGLPLSRGGEASARVLYILAEDDRLHIPRNGAGFVVAQASYVGPLTDMADVVLPAPIWAEQSGHVTNTEGRVQSVQAALTPPENVWPTVKVLKTLAGRLNLAL
ncbi:MAG: 2Fe-2S iron-sulfur cluster-binding protein [Anaerolineae bacterium]|nr:2Fe-2S iron-sulfur cluster-binding protein [Anaerolineae bacterium]